MLKVSHQIPLEGGAKGQSSDTAHNRGAKGQSSDTHNRDVKGQSSDTHNRVLKVSHQIPIIRC